MLAPALQGTQEVPRALQRGGSRGVVGASCAQDAFQHGVDTVLALKNASTGPQISSSPSVRCASCVLSLYLAKVACWALQGRANRVVLI